ncbi:MULTISPECIES: carbon-nitrogen hydrolase family protein [Pseudonocardia]|uniref:(R)-stereoselective amidase n=2 Tax=Pseudonocardia TaxID=1847 RepID=A0A1Y2N3Q7_PSEAH|nr:MULTISPECIES: carbon-nitrogen hydrolase family protein [Pseudonocardia]OSY42112.1 (R)-stereoselective amidase [Pseudonocardia autotrophica]TDN75120.1 5-aminopentanamidase [Pseudonocardia autotrophica]BBF99065.1 carbon-nitrogen hydrolase [Pseudonocardia autotrophica]GEC23985.1 carbon-nitrogen hydrolase [Pseudonocardia saturnea]
MRLALAQCVPGPRDVPGNLHRLDRFAAAGADLVVTPEMFLTGYAIDADEVRELAEPADGPSAAAVATLARRHRTAILYGYPEYDGGQVFNAVALVGPDGSRLAGYRKTHLFGELDRARFGAGADACAVVELDGWRLGLLICYDVEFPEAARGLAVAGADAVLVPTANMIGYDRVPDTLVPARAYENQLYVGYANHTGREGGLVYGGLSCIAGPDGADVARAGRGEELLFARLDREVLAASRRDNPFLADRRPELYRGLTER